jgi:hypothetical protein
MVSVWDADHKQMPNVAVSGKCTRQYDLGRASQELYIASRGFSSLRVPALKVF